MFYFMQGKLPSFSTLDSKESEAVIKPPPYCFQQALYCLPDPYLYAAGLGESVGFLNAFFNCSVIGQFRLIPFGGIGDWNHFA